MKELLFKGLMCIILAFIIINFVSTICLAYNTENNFKFDDFEKTSTDSGDIKKPFEKAIGITLVAIRIIGIGVAFVIISVVGIKYMSAAPGERADMKKSSIQYVIGAVILFGASNILTTLAESITKIVE